VIERSSFTLSFLNKWVKELFTYLVPSGSSRSGAGERSRPRVRVEDLRPVGRRVSFSSSGSGVKELASFLTVPE